MYSLVETAKCVKDLRKDMTQEKLADELHIHVDTIRKIEQAKRGMSIDLLMQIADYFDVSTDYLLGRTTAACIDRKLLLKIKGDVERIFEQELNK